MDPSSRIAFSVTEFATLVSLGRTQIYKEIASGRLHPVKVGKRTLITANEAQHWLERLAATNAPAAR